MDRKETMAKINNLYKLLTAQEKEWQRERGNMHMIQIRINSIESDLTNTRVKLGKLHQHLMEAWK